VGYFTLTFLVECISNEESIIAIASNIAFLTLSDFNICEFIFRHLLIKVFFVMFFFSKISLSTSKE
jgi:hypothetical protein